MPIYLYRCPDGHETEINRHPDDANRPAHCAECGKPAERLHRLGGVSFRGPGFHNTDYPRHCWPASDTD